MSKPRFGWGIRPRHALTLLLLVFSASMAWAGPGDTLRLVRARGTLRCGVSEGIAGFSIRDANGVWSGIDVDFCRAVAAVALGDPDRVRFVSLHATARFPSLASREIDILARNTTWTVERESIFSVVFAGVLYWDNQALLARADSPFAHADSLDGARVCVERGSNQADDLAEFARRKNWKLIPVVAADFGLQRKNLQDGACDLLTDDASALAGMLRNVPDPLAFVMRPEQVARSPLGPAVRWEDGQWIALVRAIYAALIDAEARRLTQDQARAISAAGSDADQKAYLAETAATSRALRIAPNWAAQAVAAVGNYGEIFARNLGADSKLKLERGPNRLWTDGGLLYAPPFR